MGHQIPTPTPSLWALESFATLRMDFYSLLGVTRSASQQEIKEAFRQKALQHHPDRHTTASKATQERASAHFKDICEAYKILSNEHDRAIYNASGRSAVYRQRSAGASGSAHHSSTSGSRSGPYGRSGFYTRSWSTFLLRYSHQLPLQAAVAAGVILGMLAWSSTADAIWNRLNQGKQFQDVIQRKQGSKTI